MMGNLAIYGRITPPEYDLRKVTAPVALHYSANDMLAAIVVSITCHVMYSQNESPFGFLVPASMKQTFRTDKGSSWYSTVQD
jgi:hypothetical protein